VIRRDSGRGRRTPPAPPAASVPTDALLLEDGSPLLLEDGTYLLQG